MDWSLIIEIVKRVYTPITRHAGYLIYYKKNVENLTERMRKMGVKRDDVQQLVDDARRRGEEMSGEVEGWLLEVVDIEGEVTRLDDAVKENKRCFNGWCPDLGSRYSLGKQAKKKTVDVEEILARGNFNRVSNPRPPPSIESMLAGEFEAFESTGSAMAQLIKALKDKKINIIGVYGMGGVGKTTLVEQVGKQGKGSEKLCDEVVKVTVSQNQDLKKIQGELAEKLGMPLTEENIEVRAGRLLNRLKQEKKILIILDDLWDRLDLTRVGIPYEGGQKGCQIIVTTRNKEACFAMNCQKMIEVRVLSVQDSWNLFKEKAGDVETDELQSLAKEVAKECKGLPLAIVTVARALKGKGPSVWANALRELKASSPRNVQGVDKEVYSRLELSYNYIESEEAKMCFLFCCIFPEDHNIEVGVLMRYMMGERVFKDVNNFEEAGDRIHTLVEKLKDSCLLLDGDKKGFVKMHDVVRDVAISIASKKEYGFVVKVGVQLKEWPEKLDECTRLSLMGTSISMLPELPSCPHLITLLLQGNNSLEEFPNNFVEGMKALTVMDLSNTEISSFLSPLQYLTNLKTLCLDGCKRLNDISLLGGLEILEILSLRDTRIQELPIEIGQLSNLKVLDLSMTRDLTLVAPNVISRLSKLEELYMGKSFSKWEVTGSSGDGSKAGFDEVASLAHLTVLYIHVRDVHCLSLEVPGPWEKLKKFCICVRGDSYTGSDYEKSTSIEITSYPISNWVRWLLQKSEAIYLVKVCQGVSNIVPLLKDEDGGFNSLKRLSLYDCNNMEHFINMVGESHRVPLNAFGRLQRLDLISMEKLERICHGPLPIRFFENLIKLNIDDCRKLKYILAYDLLQGFQSLENLKVGECNELEDIFHCEEGIREEVHAIPTSPLSTLKRMKLQRLPKLSTIWKGAMPPTGILHNLTELIVDDCESLRCLFSPVLAQGLQQLEVLRIYNCYKLEKIISDEEVMLTNMTRQNFSSLPPPLTFQNLRKISIISCPGLKDLFSWNLARGLQQLELLEVGGCDEIEQIISADEEEQELGVVDKESLFPRLETIELLLLPKLRSLCCHCNRGGGSHVFLNFPSLQYICVSDCQNLKKLPVGPQSAPKLEKIIGEEAWFEGLEWEDESAMSHFQPLFHPDN
ncbi:putative disease resistance protein At4g27220 [Tasmannia lanceolata]|uniref:putative disease resistance protein At4g27220 n=1 Tax=Tasmannia lanceolata TaxID=3420 RepID=UPI004063D532